MAALSSITWFASLLDIFIGYWHGQGSPLIQYFDAFQDLTIYESRFTLLHTAAFFQARILDSRFEWPPAAFAYPPAAAVIYSVFFQFAHPEIVYTTLIAGWCIFCVLGVFKMLESELQGSKPGTLIASCVLFSFPTVFLAERSNLELFVWIFITVGVLLCFRQHPHWAAVFFGLAASLKLYPILLLALFLKDRRQWPDILTGILAASTASLLAVWYCGPSFRFALHGFIDGIVRFKSEDAEAARLMEAPFDHSLFCAIKDFYFFRKDSPSQWTLPYYIISCGSVVALFLTRVNKLPFINRLMFLSIVMILIPPVSYDYTIVHLYLPLLLLTLVILHSGKQQSHLPSSQLIAFGCLLFVMLPFGLLANGRFIYAGILQLAALLSIAIAAIMSPWASSLATGEPAYLSASSPGTGRPWHQRS